MIQGFKMGQPIPYFEAHILVKVPGYYDYNKLSIVLVPELEH